MTLHQRLHAAPRYFLAAVAIAIPLAFVLLFGCVIAGMVARP